MLPQKKPPSIRTKCASAKLTVVVMVSATFSEEQIYWGVLLI